MQYWAFLVALACLSGAAAFADTHPSPLQQVRDGTDPGDVLCEPGLALVMRDQTYSACVSPASADKLSERGWSLVRAPLESAMTHSDSMTDKASQGDSMTDKASQGDSMTDKASQGDSMTDKMSQDTRVSGAYSPGPFAVGAVSNFVTDPDRPFDAWGSEYQSKAYRDVLEKIDASGQRTTVPTMIYYPAVPADGPAQLSDVHPAPLLAASQGTRSTVLDLHFGNAELVDNNSAGLDASFQYGSYKGAELAEGQFPLVVMVHGLGGGLMTWNQAAEHLASQGYVVVTLAYTSDSVSSPVFEDPDSPFATSGADLSEAYRLRAGAPLAVFSNFMSLMYGYEGEVSPASMPDPSELSARDGGGIESGKTMAALFEQRTDDLGSVIDAMAALGAPQEQCREELERDSLCGFFEGAIDSENVGVMGHSLGSMTTQSALVFLDEVDTAVAFNNGMPKRWEPFGGMPDLGLDPPAGVPKPIMFVIGSDDYFVYTVFSEIHLRWYEAAGGDTKDTFPLDSERQRPSEGNPQPVAMSAYERAQAEKAFVVFSDQGHGDATDEVQSWVEPGSSATLNRVPLSADAEPETYSSPSWVADAGGQVYLPHQMRNYLITAWFDWQLKGDDAQRQAVLDHPFGDGIRSMTSSGLEP